MMIGEIIYCVLFALNVIAFVCFGKDKRNAVYGFWRIPEAVLLGLTVLGGACGAACGMWLFRHKTRHTAFLITVPLFLILWIIGLGIACYFLSPYK